ncbi:LemA family protein [Halomonas urmiana]|uniref:LemA family protein n=1 Tax=Halomonas urmiana TaxID=490901 RepID=A0A5R8MDR0_9GAMM|nr:LemA family protein [Halomonas urmiana]
MSLSLIIPVVLLGTLLVYGVAIHNRLVALKNRYQNAFAQIAVQLKRRHDLIPNLVETAKAYMRHERETLQAVTEARKAAEVGLQHAAARPGPRISIGPWLDWCAWSRPSGPRCWRP